MHILDAHLEWCRMRGLSPYTIRDRRILLRRVEKILANGLLGASREELLAWRAELPDGPSAITTYLSHLRSFYAWAVEFQFTSSNPAAGIPGPRRPRRLPRPIGEADLMRAVTGAPPRIRPWLVLAGWSGLRAQEIAYLRAENVLTMRDDPLLFVPADAAKGRRERLVPLGEFPLAELRRHGLPRTGWVFTRLDGHPGPNRPHQVSHLANLYLHECGIAETLHQLRHRFGTAMYAAALDIRAVQEAMGHSSLDTTAGYVAWHRAEAASAAVDQLPVPGGETK